MISRRAPDITTNADTDAPTKIIRAAVVYHIWPHYRLPVMQAMDCSAQIEWTFLSGGEPFRGILHADTTLVRRFKRAPFHVFNNLIWQQGAVAAALSGKYDVIILLADVHFVSNWLAAIIGRVCGKKVLFWGHGWRRIEGKIQSSLRKAFYHLANRLLVYGERGARLGIDSGFPPDRITVVYNSMDALRADTVVKSIEAGELNSVRPHDLFEEPRLPVLICTARLTRACRFDLLIEAAAVLRDKGLPVNILLVGDGPERDALSKQSLTSGVAIHFFGSCYDEEVVGQLIYHADLSVSPGKIGLTAVHSLMYGTPAITHDNLDDQMPEVEVIEKGVTGALFMQGDSDSLAGSIELWLRSKPDRMTVRSIARAAVSAKWNPLIQASIIETAIVGEIAGSARWKRKAKPIAP